MATPSAATGVTLPTRTKSSYQGIMAIGNRKYIKRRFVEYLTTVTMNNMPNKIYKNPSTKR